MPVRVPLSNVDAEVDWLTCLDDQLDHTVAVRSVASMVNGGVVEQDALCGIVFATAPPGCIPRPPCPSCAVFVRARDSLRGAQERLSTDQAGRHTRLGWWRRLRSRQKVSVEPVMSGWEAMR